MTSFILLTLCLAALSRTSLAGYTLAQGGNYTQSTSTFFEQWQFFTEADPTAGTVNYIDQTAAQAAGMINTNGNQIYMGVDATTTTTSGRNSVRLTSTASYNTGLFILDLEHMPGGICGTWPAFWLVGPNWPNDGEIDIIEGVNNQVGNDMTLHTGPGCSVTNNAQDFSGSMTSETCTSSNADNNGCQISDSSAAAYGTGFNAAKGGVYAMEWTEQAISVWFFPRSSIPSNVASGSPDPTTWGTPVSYFSGCDIPSNFQDMQMVFDTTFCGTWGGQVFESMCPGLGDCATYVQNNPTAFADAYWTINSLSVFTSDGTTGSSSSVAPSASKPPVPVSSALSTSVAPSSTAKPTTLATSAVSSSKPSVSISSISSASIPIVQSSSTAAVVSAASSKVTSALPSAVSATMPSVVASSSKAAGSGFSGVVSATMPGVGAGPSKANATAASSEATVSASGFKSSWVAGASSSTAASAAPSKATPSPPIASEPASVATASVESTIVSAAHETSTVHASSSPIQSSGGLPSPSVVAAGSAASSGFRPSFNATVSGFARPTGTGSPRPWHHHHGHQPWSYSAGVSAAGTATAASVSGKPTIPVVSALAQSDDTPTTVKVKATVTTCDQESTETPLTDAEFPDGGEAITAPAKRHSLHFAKHKRRGGSVLRV